MSRILLSVGLVLIGLSSCKKETPKPLTEQEIQHRIDSISEIRFRDLELRAQKDLRHRIKIEVKVKADSIRNALKQKTTQ